MEARHSSKAECPQWVLAVLSNGMSSAIGKEVLTILLPFPSNR